MYETTIMFVVLYWYGNGFFILWEEAWKGVREPNSGGFLISSNHLKKETEKAFETLWVKILGRWTTSRRLIMNFINNRHYLMS
jgi:hypothetical protein